MSCLAESLRVSILSGALAVTPALAAAPPPRCELDAAESRWIGSALDTWETVRSRDLRLSAESLPWMVFYDARCAWHLQADPARFAAQHSGAAEAGATIPTRGGSLAARGVTHDGNLTLPDGGSAAARIASFASAWGEANRPFLAMALPSLWRADPKHRDDPGLDLLMRAVLVHEMTHTRQADALGARIGALAAAHGLGDDFDDDIIQDRFGERAGFRAAYERGRDLLFSAAHASDSAARRRLAADALAAWRDRRRAFFKDADAFYAELEDVFLDLEGAANWAAYRMVRAELGSDAEAESSIRRGGRRWSQDEGLAIFLLLDAAVADWRERVFSAEPPSLETLLAEAATR